MKFEVLVVFWGVIAAAVGNELQKSDVRSATPQTTTPSVFFKFFSHTNFQRHSKDHHNPTATFQNLRLIKQSKLERFLEEVKTCRKNHTNLNIKFFIRQLYCFLRGRSTPSFHCNITKEFLDLFQTNPPVVRKQTRTREAVYADENMELKLGDEWLPLKSKVSHLSHIYLGTSMFPLLTEESRILEGDPTVPSPTSASVTVPSIKIYQLLQPFTWGGAPRKNTSRWSRSERTHVPTEEEGRDEGDDTLISDLINIFKVRYRDETKADCPLYDEGYDGYPFHRVMYFICSSVIGFLVKTFDMSET